MSTQPYRNPVEQKLDALLVEAALFRRRGDRAHAVMVKSIVDEMRQALEQMMREKVTIKVAAEISGQTEAHLRQLVNQEQLTRYEGDKGGILVSVGELPYKIGKAHLAKVVGRIQAAETPRPAVGAVAVKRVG